jgi:hypothetical protein
MLLQVPGLLSAAAGAALQMQLSPPPSAAAAAAAAAGSTVTILPQLPLLAHLMLCYHKAWPWLSRQLCGQLNAEEHAEMEKTGSLWQQHQQYQQQQQQQNRARKRTAPAARTLAGMVLLGNTSILLQQLLKIQPAAAAAAAAVASSRQQQQQQQQREALLRLTLLYCADALGDQLGSLWEDLLVHTKRPEQRVLGPLSTPCCTALARALQVFEAAVRRLASAVPAAAAAVAAAGGGDVPPSSSMHAVVPPSISHVELTAAAMYVMIICYNYVSRRRIIIIISSSSSGGGGGRKALPKDLTCPQQQLLQSALSMLLTNAKLWQARVVQPISIEILRDAASAAAAAAAAAAPTIAAATAPPPAAAAAATAAAGTAQIVQVVTRHLSWFEKQLRDWISFGDALSPARLLTSTADHSILPPYIDLTVREPPSVPSAGYTHHDTLHSLTRLCCTLACLCSSNDAERLEIQRSRDQILRWAPPKGFINPQGQVQQPQDMEKVPLGYLGTLADGLLDFVSTVTGAVPSRFGCNWPGCVRLEGVSESYGLVRGKACVCGGCGVGR